MRWIRGNNDPMHGREVHAQPGAPVASCFLDGLSKGQFSARFDGAKLLPLLVQLIPPLERRDLRTSFYCSLPWMRRVRRKTSQISSRKKRACGALSLFFSPSTTTTISLFFSWFAFSLFLPLSLYVFAAVREEQERTHAVHQALHQRIKAKSTHATLLLPPPPQ